MKIASEFIHEMGHDIEYILPLYDIEGSILQSPTFRKCLRYGHIFLGATTFFLRVDNPPESGLTNARVDNYDGAGLDFCLVLYYGKMVYGGRITPQGNRGETIFFEFLEEDCI